jgi:hypothetical protein
MRKVATATTAATHKLFVHTALTLVSSTDATPIVVTIPADHGFEVGDSITIAGHTTNVGANGTFVLSAVSATTVTLTGSVGSGAGAGGADGTITFSDPLYTVPETKVWVAFEALTNDCYIRVGTAQTAATTAANGILIKASATPGLIVQNQRFYLTPSKHTNVDILSTTGAGVLKWYVCSPPGERERI